MCFAYTKNGNTALKNVFGQKEMPHILFTYIFLYTYICILHLSLTGQIVLMLPGSPGPTDVTLEDYCNKRKKGNIHFDEMSKHLKLFARMQT